MAPKLIEGIPIRHPKPDDLIVFTYVVRGHRDVKIEAREFGNDGNPTRWAVTDTGYVLNADGIWEYEPSPSSRTDDFVARARYDTPEAAMNAYIRWFESQTDVEQQRMMKTR